MKKAGKCMVCGGKVENWGDYDEFKPENWDQINAAVLGNYIPLQGHRACLANVDNLVVDPNRTRHLKFRKRLDDYLSGPVIP
jgi:hypothetical protein